ncbi:MAG: T9SS type A sorting domain-containing protein [Bacteroidia bacterium]
MKKIVLIGSALAISFAGYSQNSAKNAVNQKWNQKISIYERLKTKPEPTNYVTNPNAQRTKIRPSNPLATCGNQFFTTAVNCFAVGGGGTTEQQTCLSYNKDLNAVNWTTRTSSSWLTSCSLTSGAQQVNWLYVAANKWDSTIIYTDPTAGGVQAGRYPGGTFLANPGDTAVANAFAVGSGPITNGAGATWTATWYSARPLTGGDVGTCTTTAYAGLHSLPTPTTSVAPDGTGTVTPGIFGRVSSGFLNVDMQQLDGGKVAIVAGALTNPSITATNAGTISGAVFGKATLSGASAPYTVTWSADSLKPPFYVGTTPGGYLNNSEGARIAFGPDGLTGYAVFIGKLKHNYGNKSDTAFTPIVYKSTDGGVTWDSTLFGYDWTCKHPECLKNVNGYADSAKFLNISKNNFSFTSDNGMDLTVDKNGVLHLVCTLIPPSKYQDSLAFGFDYYYDYGQQNFMPAWQAVSVADRVYSNTWPYIWDFMTDGTAAYGWRTMLVDSLLSGPCSNTGDTKDTTSIHSAFYDGTSAYLPVNAHITVSRSTDGTAVFYGWADSDPSSSGYAWNNVPDVYIKGYNVVTGNISSKMNLTGSTPNAQTCYYPYLSTESYYDNTQSAWVVPMVFGTGSVTYQTSPQITYNGVDAMNFYYNNCGVFPASAFSIPATTYTSPTGTVCSTVGIKTYSNAFASSIGNYPNPFDNTTTIAVTLSEQKAVDIKVYNALGTLVFSKKVDGTVGQNNVTFDGGPLSSGVYYYTVTAGNEQATKKMIIQK